MNRKWVVWSALVLVTGACALVWYVGWRQNNKKALKTSLASYGWQRLGADYKVEIDHGVTHGGNSSALIRYAGSAPPAPVDATDDGQPFGAVGQRFKADDYRGKSVRMSAYVRTEDAGWAALWLRVDGQMTVGLRFDNMDNRPIRGTTDWQKYEITLDVPEEGSRIFLGALLAGGGKMWVDDFQFDVVGGEPARSAPEFSPNGPGLPPRPVDLDFEL